MFDLSKIYSGTRLAGNNPDCEGCSVLDKNKPCHSIMDYQDLKESKVLFLSDSFKIFYGNPEPFSKVEVELIKESYPETQSDNRFVISSAIKCPSVKDEDMTPSDKSICRKHLEETIDKVKPTLVFPCGNLAMKMLIKKSGITDKRGKAFDYVTEKGHSCTVVPLFHPYSCIKEPRHLPLFQNDIKNAYEKYILNYKSDGTFNYEVLMDIEKVRDLSERLKDSEETIAVDIETTGLNFLKDSVMTISISATEKTWVIPLDHKDSPFKKPHTEVWVLLRKILENPKNKKVFHNAKFDLKFLINHGIYTKNVWDTKIMHHVIDENIPKSLMELVKFYFSEELESL
jgi:hypothetical protein